MVKVRFLFTIAQMTFFEAIKKRFIIFILITTAFLLLLNLTCETHIQINGETQNFSRIGAFLFFYLVGIWNIGISLQITSSLIAEELDNRTYLFFITKPIPKIIYYLGKTLGILFIIISNSILFFSVYSLSVYIRHGYFFIELWKSFLPMLLGYILLISIVLILCLLLNKTSSIMITSAILLFSFIIDSIHYETKIEKFLTENFYFYSKIFYWLLPQFGTLTFYASSLFESSISQVHYLGEYSIYQVGIWILIIWNLLFVYLMKREFNE